MKEPEMPYPKLFENQPKITEKLLAVLEKRGLIVSDKSLHQGERRTTVVSNPTAGEIIGYSLLAKKLKAGEVSQDDARVLLAIEACREKGPRETHIGRLIPKAFEMEKENVINKINSWREN